MVVQLHPGLHLVQHRLLGAVAADRAVHFQRGLAHRAEGGQRVQHQADAVLGQLFRGVERRGAEFGDVGQHRHLHRFGEALVHGQVGHRFGEDHVGAGLHTGDGARDGGVQAFHGQRVGARHDDEVGVAAGIGGGLMRSTISS